MKKITLLAAFMCMGAYVSHAQAAPEKVNSTVLSELNFRNTLWFNSDNTAGLAFAPLGLYNDLNLMYHGESGEFAPQQTGTGSNDISLETSGTVRLGKLGLWGDFSFSNIFERGRMYNAISYESEDDMPYYVADINPSSWTKQAYDMGARINSPVLWDKLSFGAEIRYTAKVGAKQKDPRCETYKYNVEVKPSVALRLGKSILGLNLLYENRFERSDPSNSNSRFSQTVYLTKGLGEATIAKVGDNDGIKEYYYKGNRFGGGLQWGLSTPSVEILTDLDYSYRKLDCITTPKLPKRMGTTLRHDVSASIQMLSGEYKCRKISLDAEFKTSSGLEQIQQIDNTPQNQQWILLAENAMSSYNLLTADLGYDRLFGNSDPRGYDWKIAANALFRLQKDSYSLPPSTFSNMNAGLDVSGARQFKMESSSILLGADVLYNKAFKDYAKYVYGGTPDTKELQQLYWSDLEYWTTDYVKAGINAAFNYNWTKVNLVVNLSADYVIPFGKSVNRLVLQAAVGILF